MNSTSRSSSDHYTRKAKQQGFPARSVWKLIEIDQRYRLLRRGIDVLDLGSAPGSWALYAHRQVGSRGSVTAVDTVPKPSSLNSLGGHFTYLQSDLTSRHFRSQLSGQNFDLILSDAAPSTCGNHTVDAARSAELVDAVLSIASKHLRRQANLVVKILQGDELYDLLSLARNYFSKVQTFKPKASRGKSSETFLLAFGYGKS